MAPEKPTTKHQEESEASPDVLTALARLLGRAAAHQFLANAPSVTKEQAHAER